MRDEASSISLENAARGKDFLIKQTRAQDTRGGKKIGAPRAMITSQSVFSDKYSSMYFSLHHD